MSIFKSILALTCIVFTCAVILYVAMESFRDKTSSETPTASGNYERTEPMHGEIDVERYRTGTDTDMASQDSGSQGFAYDYYKAVEDQDWDATYSMLDSESQSLYTKEEWTALQAQRVYLDGGSPPLESADLTLLDGGDATRYAAEATLFYTDGSSDTIPIEVTAELTDGAYLYKRHLSESDIEYLDSLGEGEGCGVWGCPEEAGTDEESTSLTSDEATSLEVTDRGGNVVPEDDPLYDYYKLSGEVDREQQEESDRNTENEVQRVQDQIDDAADSYAFCSQVRESVEKVEKEGY